MNPIQAEPLNVRKVWRQVSATMRQRGAKASFFAPGHSCPMAWQVKQGKGWLTVDRDAAKLKQRSRRRPYDMAMNRSNWLCYVGKEGQVRRAC